MNRTAALIAALMLVCASPSWAGRSSHADAGHAGYVHHSKAIASVTRDKHGRIARSQEATHAFKRTHPCPATGHASGRCPGYVIDHVIPLKRGGPDQPSNMQWQTKEAAKAKDKTE